MTEKELWDKNPWRAVADNMECVYSEQGSFTANDKEREAIDEFNDKKKRQNKPDEKLIDSVPPEPWQGNPLNAKVIFLSLNPGFVERINITTAKLIQTCKGTLEKLLDFKRKTLLLEADSFLPEDNDKGGDDKPISCRDAMSLLGDEYWENKFSNLISEVVNDGYTVDQFYRDVAIMQYHAYTSKVDGGFPNKNHWPLPSQEFTRDLIKHVAEKNPNTVFVIMRAKDRWVKLLGEEWCNTMRGRLLIRNNKSMSQAISEKNLGTVGDNGEHIYDIIKQALNGQRQG